MSKHGKSHDHRASQTKCKTKASRWQKSSSSLLVLFSFLIIRKGRHTFRLRARTFLPESGSFIFDRWNHSFSGWKKSSAKVARHTKVKLSHSVLLPLSLRFFSPLFVRLRPLLSFRVSRSSSSHLSTWVCPSFDLLHIWFLINIGDCHSFFRFDFVFMLDRRCPLKTSTPPVRSVSV